MTRWRVLPMGDRAALIECTDGDEASAIAAALADSPAPGQRELVPGARSVLLTADRPVDVHALADRLGATGPRTVPATTDAVTIDVVYDGPDLAEVAELTSLGVDGVVAAHTGVPWRVGFTGFAPGFGYLTGGDQRLAVPRRATPRPAVPAGAVGLAGEFSGVYPRASPGGWQLIGRTDAVLWDSERDPPALLRPGTAVSFRAVPAIPRVGSPTTPHSPSWGTRLGTVGGGGRTLTVVRPGISCLVQDLGRPGFTAQGVGRSGAADLGAALRANRIVGNRVGAAVLEFVPGRVEVKAGGALLLAITGAAGEIAVDGTPARTDAPIALSDGQTLTIAKPPDGLRRYLAVRGGVAVPPVLGSRSTDLLAGLGPAAIRAGDVLPIGHDHWGTPRVVEPPTPPRDVAVYPGPQADWFSGGLAALTDRDWRLLPSSNRVGLRLDGEALGRTRPGEVPTQGLLPGAIQVPPDGRPVIVFVDHPVTGGYPVIAVVATADLDRLAQLRPGRPLRLCASSPA